MNNCVFINCDNNYVLKSIIALKQFNSLNPKFDMYIIGTKFNNKNKKLCDFFNIKIKEIDLSKDFINLDKRPYGQKYPIECFYHFYAYKILDNYDYLILIEPDIYTNKTLDINLKNIKYIAGGYDNDKLIKNFTPLMNDYNKIKKIYKTTKIDIPKISGGVKIYNAKNLYRINFYEKILEYYNKSIQINAQRCGDDSLMVMYQMLNPKYVKLLSPEFHVINAPNNKYSNSYAEQFYFFHFTLKFKKYWSNSIEPNLFGKYFSNKMREYVKNNFPNFFIEKALPKLKI